VLSLISVPQPPTVSLLFQPYRSPTARTVPCHLLPHRTASPCFLPSALFPIFFRPGDQRIRLAASPRPCLQETRNLTRLMNAISVCNMVPSFYSPFPELPPARPFLNIPVPPFSAFRQRLRGFHIEPIFSAYPFLFCAFLGLFRWSDRPSTHYLFFSFCLKSFQKWLSRSSISAPFPATPPVPFLLPPDCSFFWRVAPDLKRKTSPSNALNAGFSWKLFFF